MYKLEESIKPGRRNFTTDVGCNANLNRIGWEIGLERSIYEALELGLKDSVFGGKTVADTVEAILGGTYLDSGLKKVKEVMDTLDLVSKARKVEKILESEGFVMFDGNGYGDGRVSDVLRGSRTPTL